MNQVEIKLNYSPVVNYAMQQNHVPVIRDLVIINNGSHTLTDIEVNMSFDPEFAAEYRYTIHSLQAGSEEKTSVIPIMISTDFLANLTEKISGNIKVSVLSGGSMIGEERFDISLLSFNEWAGSGIMPEMLAAFSTPNHPEVNLIIKRASEILGRWTGNPSFNAYQSDDNNRVKQQMAAIYEAIREKDITYCVAPASFEERGQRIRTIDEIVSLRVANCLDMTMMYVSCLEAAGLNPLVILTERHSFAGCWLVNETFIDAVNDDPSLLSKRMADGINEILLVECTSMNEGSRSRFDKSCDAAAKSLEDRKFEMFIDISRARTAQIRPLPLRISDENGRYIIPDKGNCSFTWAPSKIEPVNPSLSGTQQVNKKIIWERKLLDLTLRNNLLNLKLSGGIVPFLSTDVSTLEKAVGNNSDFKVCPRPTDWDSDLLSDGLYKIINATDPIYDLVHDELLHKRIRTLLDDDELKERLTDLYRASRNSLEENGANSLYIALGLLKWFEGETEYADRPHYAPILLIPVEIIRKSASSGYIIRGRGEETMVNITLLEFLRQMHGINISGLEELQKNSGGKDSALIFNVMRRAIMDMKKWDVLEYAVLGNFSFNKFIMWNDIHSNPQMLDESKIVSSLMNGILDKDIDTRMNEEVNLDDQLNAEDIVLPLSADSSQIDAVTASMNGKSFILHGPPGTGKSQTITNIIANALYKGKKVLFVAEKRAALEVVQNRLKAIGLAPFCLELHSNKAKKSSVMDQFKRITEISKTKSPQEYWLEAERINNVRNEMNLCLKSLHKVHPLGLSLYDCIARYESLDEAVPCFDFPVSKAADLNGTCLDDMKAALAELKVVLDIVGTPVKHPLHGIDCSEYSLEVENALSSIPGINKLLDAACGKLKVLNRKYSDEDLQYLESEWNEILSKKSILNLFNKRRFVNKLGVDKRYFFDYLDLKKEINTLLSTTLIPFNSSIDISSGNSLENARDMLARWHSGRGSIRQWILYSRLKNKIDDLGFGVISEQIETGSYKTVDFIDSFFKTIYKAYAEYILTTEPELSIFNGALFEEKIKRFRELSRKFEELTREEIYARVAANLPELQKEASKNCEVGIMQKNIRNGCRGVSIRNFFASIPDLLPRICPCMLMSPISVAQYIEANGMKFDMVIFDEASQMPTCEAVGTIARGNSIIVVGDPNQLPPTNFFDINAFDEEHHEIEDLESILDDCLALSLPSKHLRWHYRSRHESLIAFSNSRYYDNRLLTFPSPDDLQTRIAYQHVDGVYDRGGSRQNKEEAQAIIDEIKVRLEDPQKAGMSIGVVTFNSNQQSLIEDKLNSMFINNPHLEKVAMESPEPIFVKNLENVQGDERDVILFSIGYGADKEGKVTMNFGPLNREGGWRRLNVAVSRARHEMKVFSTLTSDQIDLNKTSAQGVAGLKEFLEYVERGKLVSCNSKGGGIRDGFIENVADELRRHGHEVRTNIGSSGYKIDIGIINPENPDSYILAVICDGYNYASSRCARDREIIQMDVLRSLGWNTYHLWAMDWWTMKDATLKKLLATIEGVICRVCTNFIKSS
jgi:superfamily I DNA and/or RNA helicase